MTRFAEDLELVNDLGVSARRAEMSAMELRHQAEVLESTARGIRRQIATINAHIIPTGEPTND